MKSTVIKKGTVKNKMPKTASEKRELAKKKPLDSRKIKENRATMKLSTPKGKGFGISR